MLCGETHRNNRCFEKDESIIDVISNAFGDISGFDKILVLDEARVYAIETDVIKTDVVKGENR